MSMRQSLHPRRASVAATAVPTPPAPPVMIATWPTKSRGGSNTGKFMQIVAQCGGDSETLQLTNRIPDTDVQRILDTDAVPSAKLERVLTIFSISRATAPE
jgi:hypothetical protein